MENKRELFEDIIAVTMSNKYNSLIEAKVSDGLIDKVWGNRNIHYDQQFSITYAVERKYKG